MTDKAHHRKELRHYIEDFKTDKKCLYCPESDSICLEFHHRNPQEKIDTIPNLIKKGVSLRDLIKEMNKCDLLCSNCHKKKHRDMKEPLNE